MNVDENKKVAGKLIPISKLKRKAENLDRKVAPYRYGFDKWNVEVIDSDPQNKIARTEIDSGRENRCPNAGEIEMIEVVCSDDLADVHENQLTDDIKTNTNEPKLDRDMKKVPLLLSGKYFRILNRENGSIKACCIGCQNVYSAPTNVTSNLVTHLKKHHPEEYEQYQEEKNSTKKTKQTNASYEMGEPLTQQKLDAAIIRLITKKLLPISMVEDEHFREFILTMLAFKSEENCPLKIMSRHDLKHKLSRSYSELQTYMRNQFQAIEHLCLTVDIWGTKHRSYLGCTLHYIDPTLLQRKSFALACNRFPHPHTNDQIAEQIQMIYTDYDLKSDQVFATLMDNAANFQKAFQEYGLNHQEFALYAEQIAREQNLEQIDENNDNEHVFFPEVGESLSLSNRMPCGSHTLNLIGTKDIAQAQSDKLYAKAYVSAFAKLNRLWNKTNYSKSSETIRDILNSSISRPCISRWNAIPTAVSEVLSKNPEQMDALMVKLDIPSFTTQDRQFLSEYIKVLTPITSALNNLQKTDCFYGIFLPTLFTIKRALIAFQFDTTIKYCKPLAVAALAGLEKRFANVLDFKSKYSVPALIATCSHPFFKFRWLREVKTPENIEYLKRILLKAAEEIEPKSDGNASDDRAKRNDDKKKNVFDYDLEENAEFTKSLSSEMEVLSWLQQPCATEIHDLSQLHKFPLIKDIFIKFNTPLTSSAPVERLFSFAGMILRPQRQKLCDDLFEQLLILNANDVQLN